MQRPVDEEALYNPAFLACLIAAAAHEYAQGERQALPWAVAFVVPAFVLASQVREILPHRSTAYLANWIAANPEGRIDVALRAQSLSPFVRDALRFGIRSGLLTLRNGRLNATLSAAALERTFENEAREILHATRLLGRWLRKEEAVNIFALLRIRP